MADKSDPLKSVRDLQVAIEKSIGPARQVAESLRATRLPDFAFPKLDRYELPELNIPTPEERNEYQSATAFMEAIATSAVDWKEALPPGIRPGIIAVLNGGLTMEVSSLTRVSFHGIQVQGILNGNPTVLLAHQATIQILCVAYTPDENTPCNPIGFIWPANRVEI